MALRIAHTVQSPTNSRVQSVVERLRELAKPVIDIPSASNQDVTNHLEPLRHTQAPRPLYPLPGFITGSGNGPMFGADGPLQIG